VMYTHTHKHEVVMLRTSDVKQAIQLKNIKSYFIRPLNPLHYFTLSHHICLLNYAT
jgi:hypothetical protein